jgi:hypothetical protein
MRFNVQVDLNIEGNKLRQSNTIYCKEEILPEKIYEWIRTIKRETGYRDTVILRVIYDGEHDVTEVVREMEKAPFN